MFCKALAGRSKTMGASLDVGHIASCGYDTVDAVRKLAPHLKMVHLKDIQASGGEVNVLLGKGIARIPEVMAELRKVNYTGLVAIEYEHEGPVDEDVRLEVEYARKLLEADQGAPRRHTRDALIFFIPLWDFSERHVPAPQPLGPLEITVMEIVWTHGESNVREVVDRLGRPWRTPP